MALDKWIAVFFLIISIIYGYASYSYQLLPFEKNMSFLPNTLPNALSVIGIIISGIIIFSKKIDAEGNDVDSNIDLRQWQKYKVGQAGAMLVAMVAYALLLRPMGFIPSTVLFLVGSGWILGERKLHIMVTAAVIGTGVIWYLVQEVLGIFLKPLPWFMG